MVVPTRAHKLDHDGSGVDAGAFSGDDAGFAGRKGRERRGTDGGDGSRDASGGDGGGEAGIPADAAVEAATQCDTSKPFMAPVLVAGVNTSADEARPFLSPDELTIYFDRGPAQNRDIFVATRAAVTDAFSKPVLVLDVDTNYDEADPAISADGKTLFFVSNRPPAVAYTIFSVTALTDGGGFGSPTVVPTLANPNGVARPYPQADGKELWFSTLGPSAIYHETWTGSSFGTPIAEPELNGDAGVDGGAFASVVSDDTLTIYFANQFTNPSIWQASRPNTSSPFSGSMPAAGLDGGTSDYRIPDWISPDGCTLYFENTDSNGSDIYVAKRGG